MKYNHYISASLVALSLLCLSSCSLFNTKVNEQPVAKVMDRYLYRSDLAEAIPKGTREQDSIAIARNFIDAWVRKQLMLIKAEEALTDEQKNVQRKIEEYRSSLLIYSYRQKLLQQKMDTVLTEQEILSYYESNIDNFILSEEIVMATFIKVPLTAPNIGNVRNWIRSGSIDDLDNLEKYSLNYAKKFDMFNNSWIYFRKLMEQIPMAIPQPDRYLRYNKNIETSDSLYHYFVHISDYKPAGDIVPLELIREDIKNILLNKRKIEFYKNLEQQVYNEGVNRNQFEIY